MSFSVYFFALFLLTSKLYSQATDSNINPKGKLFIGSEVGYNNIISKIDNKHSFQGGILSEYYFSKQWSVLGKIKYYKIGVSFYKPNTHTGSIYDLGSDEYRGNFEGEIIFIPINLKWEFDVYKKLKTSLKLGVAYNFETKSNYIDYSPQLSS
ncbi:hypothetical protein JSO59_009825 [Riemerella anatipestifer]|uniref:hypothetical protein n=1 Tax=Riemerella anatipestifer TaxID=34085 RepID=UPI0030C27B97